MTQLALQFPADFKCSCWDTWLQEEVFIFQVPKELQKRDIFMFDKMASLAVSSSKMKKRYAPCFSEIQSSLIFLTCMNRSMKINSTELSHAKWLLNWEHTKNSLYSAQHEGLHPTSLWSWSRVLPLTFQELSLPTTRVNTYSWILTVSSYVNPNVKNHTKWIV